MNAIDRSNDVAFPALEEAIDALIPQVESLVRRISGAEPSVESEDKTMRVEAGVSFPDGIGTGSVVAELFKYRDRIRLDVRLLHDRKFARSDGSPSGRDLYLNDYVASCTIETGSDEIPQSFKRQVISGIAAARDAVRRHNRAARGPWDEVNVASSED